MRPAHQKQLVIDRRQGAVGHTPGKGGELLHVNRESVDFDGQHFFRSSAFPSPGMKDPAANLRCSGSFDSRWEMSDRKHAEGIRLDHYDLVEIAALAVRSA